MVDTFDGDIDQIRLAARLKVAAVVTGSPTLPAGRQTWRDLVDALGTAERRQEARRAWQAALSQRHVPVGRVLQYERAARRRMAAAPDEDHRTVPLLAPEEIQALLGMSDGPTRPLPRRRFHELFEERAARHPQAVAAHAGDGCWSYRELNQHANRIAWRLHEDGLRPGEVVAVRTERDLPWLAAVLAVLKAGACYLPIEPGLPPDRIAAMQQRSGCRRILTGDGLLDGPPRPDDPRRDVHGAQRAYMFFTSGSTGQPKAATCTHDGLLNHLLAKIEDFDLAEGRSVAQTAPQGFDISLWQLLAPLLVGGSTHIVAQDVIVDADRFLDTLAASGVEVAQLVPSYLEVLLSAQEARPRRLPRLQRVSVTGEALKWPLVQRWFAAFPDVPLVNAYGLTETSDDTNHETIAGPLPPGPVPIGRPVRNTRVLVVDDRLDLVPVGAVGEIVMSGVCVGEGYANDPARTAVAFVADPHRPGRRLYRSGDFGRWLPSGTLEYLGRRDAQVKLHGQRLELGEVEHRLARLAVRDAAVLLAGPADRPRLVAFYSDLAAPEPGEVRAALAGALPAYMVPQELHRVAALPLTANGKVDRNALRRLCAEAPAGGEGHEPPATGTERRVARLWSQLLDVPLESIGRGSQFAELGGTSLSAIRFAIGLDRALSIAELRDAGTVAEVAALLDHKAGSRS
ncbi:non-ribosomal peptide synthetase [Dactylosporangium vinaceum]|uniref:Amino acid adenylation domain-containing protein n=1 Tax=Dactylosporangium vinaceum TaxID=53362 RepID=A0ABV5M2T9_9ACTN|nr:non-ribosomal peptide synthetase [Dactylosporangium vinaceum]UAB99886.1 non-ribosomal peptide synthetase [Dactylosporangium vinaceum]